MTLKLHTVIASTRPTRVGPTIANWFHGVAEGWDGFDAELIDLAAFDLPVYDEPKHPRFQDYAHDHTNAWSASVAAADAFVFVTPEYNYMLPPALLNALNFVYAEWNYKPVGFVSYGGISGGLRGVQTAKLMATTLRMMPIMEAVVIPMVGASIGTDGEFTPNEIQAKGATDMLAELQRVSKALKSLRA